MNDGREPRADPEARTRAPIRLVPRTFAWLIVFLRWPIIIAWIAAAVYVMLALPGIPDTATDEVEVTVTEGSANQAPTVTASVDDANGPAPHTAHFTAVGNDPDGLVLGKFRGMHIPSTRFWEDEGFGYRKLCTGEGHW